MRQNEYLWGKGLKQIKSLQQIVAFAVIGDPRSHWMFTADQSGI